MKKMIKKCSIIFTFIYVLTASLSSTAVRADVLSGVPLKDKYSEYRGNQSLSKYVDLSAVPKYTALFNELPVDGTKDVIVDIHDIDGIKIDISGVNIGGLIGKDSFYWSDETESIEFVVDIAEKGSYEISMEYYLPNDGNQAAVRSIYVNGELPFLEASNIAFYKKFRDAGKPMINSLGDETRPSQEQMLIWRETSLVESTGLVSEPLMFYFDKGKHTVRMDYITGDMHVAGITLKRPQELPTYEQVKNEYMKNGYVPSKQSVYFEAENSASEKNQSTARREYDADPSVTPQSSDGSRKLNVIGGNRWSTGNSSITWEFSVPETGLYKIGVRAKQTYNDGLPSYRQIAIDGKVPFTELLEFPFLYNTDWKMVTLGNTYEDFEFYLTEGVHHLTMTVKFGPIVDVIYGISEDSELLSKIIMDITMIAGSEPDPNYNYEFFKTIPDLQSNLQKLSKSMESKHDKVVSMSGKNVAMASNFMTIKAQLDYMAQNQLRINNSVKDLDNALTNLGSWYASLQNQPLVVDKFVVGGENADWSNKNASIFQRIGGSVVNLLRSYTKDYTAVGSILDDSVQVNTMLDVWVSRGTEWAEIIKELADVEFTPKTGIAININILPASQLSAGSTNALMLSITSGKAPDVAMGIDANSPVEFAIRDAVVDLSKMKGFDEVKSQFIPEILTPYTYEGGVYAMPETMDINVLFYRKDIFNRLGLGVPDTREELYKFVLPVLYQNGMQFYFGRDFTQILFQHGGGFYTDDGYFSALNTGEAYRAFVEYTELFTNYGTPNIANFYNRFRTGEMPIGVGNFQTYLQLSVAAPELSGKWGIAPIMGIAKENGIIDRSAGVLTAQGDVIMAQSQKQEEAWEFLKWWVSAETQKTFAEEVESLMGMQSRWNSANLEAFKNLSWSKSDLSVFEEQWKWAKETPVVLGGYFTTRHITNAWTSTVMSGSSPRDSLEAAVKAINKELKSKQEEYGIFVDRK